MPGLSNNPTSDQFELARVATSIVDQQDGKTVAGLLERYGDQSCTYNGDSLWTLDGKDADDEDMAIHLKTLMIELDEVLLASLIADYA